MNAAFLAEVIIKFGNQRSACFLELRIRFAVNNRWMDARFKHAPTALTVKHEEMAFPVVFRIPIQIDTLKAVDVGLVPQTVDSLSVLN